MILIYDQKILIDFIKQKQLYSNKTEQFFLLNES